MHSDKTLYWGHRDHTWLQQNRYFLPFGPSPLRSISVKKLKPLLKVISTAKMSSLFRVKLCLCISVTMAAGWCKYAHMVLIVSANGVLPHTALSHYLNKWCPINGCGLYSFHSENTFNVAVYIVHLAKYTYFCAALCLFSYTPLLINVI